jgi:hypothetical protein
MLLFTNGVINNKKKVSHTLSLLQGNFLGKVSSSGGGKFFGSSLLMTV